MIKDKGETALFRGGAGLPVSGKLLCSGVGGGGVACIGETALFRGGVGGLPVSGKLLDGQVLVRDVADIHLFIRRRGTLVLLM